MPNAPAASLDATISSTLSKALSSSDWYADRPILICSFNRRALLYPSSMIAFLASWKRASYWPMAILLMVLCGTVAP